MRKGKMNDTFTLMEYCRYTLRQSESDTGEYPELIGELDAQDLVEVSK